MFLSLFLYSLPMFLSLLYMTFFLLFSSFNLCHIFVIKSHALSLKMKSSDPIIHEICFTPALSYFSCHKYFFSGFLPLFIVLYKFFYFLSHFPPVSLFSLSQLVFLSPSLILSFSHPVCVFFFWLVCVLFFCFSRTLIIVSHTLFHCFNLSFSPLPHLCVLTPACLSSDVIASCIPPVICLLVFSTPLYFPV